MSDGSIHSFFEVLNAPQNAEVKGIKSVDV